MDREIIEVLLCQTFLFQIESVIQTRALRVGGHVINTHNTTLPSTSNTTERSNIQ